MQPSRVPSNQRGSTLFRAARLSSPVGVSCPELLLNFNAMPETHMPFEVGGLGLRVLIHPGSVRVLLAIDHDGEIAGPAFPGADTGVSAGLQEFVLD